MRRNSHGFMNHAMLEMYCRQLRLSEAAYWALSTLGYNSWSSETFAQYLTNYHRSSPRDPFPDERAAQNALNELLGRGWIVEIDAAYLEFIREWLAAGTGKRSVVRLPSLGDYDLTLEGAAHREYLTRAVHGHTESSRCVVLDLIAPRTLEVCATRRRDVMREVQRYDSRYKLLACEPVTRIDWWYVSWWKLLPHGWTATALLAEDPPGLAARG